MSSFLMIVGVSVTAYFSFAAFRYPTLRLRFVMIALCGAILWYIAGYKEPVISDAPKVASATQEPTTATPATEPPAPKPDHHTERQAIQVYWNHVINSLAIANEATVAASTFVQNADLVSASQMLKQGRGATEQAKEMSQKDVPDGYNEIASTLLLASNDFADAITKESDYLDSSTPSVGAEALSKKQSALSQIEDAQHAARLKYVELGGKIDDLESFAGAAKATDDLMKVLSK